MTEQDNKNYEIIKELVDERFSLTNESQELFNSLLEKPKMTDLLSEYFKDAVDGRLRFEINDDLLEDNDLGWDMFKKQFTTFISHYNLTYSDFRNGRLIIDKNIVKINKAVKAFYLKNTIEDNGIVATKWSGSLNVKLVSIPRNNDGNLVIGSIIKEIQKKELKNIEVSDLYFYVMADKKISDIDYDDIYIFNSIYSIENDKGVMKLSTIVEEKLLTEIVPSLKTSIIYYIEQNISVQLEKVAVKKLPNKKLEIVVSRNFTDWFLCSTGNNWGSCLDLVSSYESAYWSGLPGTIADPNRIVIYTTDGTKKLFYGITADKMIQRTWGIQTTNDEFCLSRWYSTEQFSSELVCKTIGLKLLKNDNYWISKKPIELIYFKNGFSSFIYMDNSKFLKVENEFKIAYGASDSYSIRESDSRTTTSQLFDVDRFQEDSDHYGLVMLIEDCCELMECDVIGKGANVCFEETGTCDICGADCDDLRSVSNGDYACNDCFESHYHECDECGSNTHDRELTEIGNDLICDDCISRGFVEIDGVFMRKTDLFRVQNDNGAVHTHFLNRGFLTSKRDFRYLVLYNWVEDKPTDCELCVYHNMYFKRDLMVYAYLPHIEEKVWIEKFKYEEFLKEIEETGEYRRLDVLNFNTILKIYHKDFIIENERKIS